MSNSKNLCIGDKGHLYFSNNGEMVHLQELSNGRYQDLRISMILCPGNDCDHFEIILIDDQLTTSVVLQQFQ